MYLARDGYSDSDAIGIRRLMDRLQLGFWDHVAGSDSFNVTRAWREMRGIARDAPVDLGPDGWLHRIHDDDRDRLTAVLSVRRGKRLKKVDLQYRYRHEKTGRWIWILTRARIMHTDSGGRPTRIVGVDSEITELKRREAEALRLSETLRLANDIGRIGVWEFDEVSSSVLWDDRMMEIYGVVAPANRIPGSFWEDRLHPDDRDEMVRYAEDCQRYKRDFNRDYRIIRGDGETRHIRSLARQVRIGGRGTRLVGVNIDVTEDYRRAEELEAARARLEHAALHDELTGLGNRRQLDLTCDAVFERFGPDDLCAVLHLDLDRFKPLNDRLGHAAGDEALRVVARRLTARLPQGGRAFRVGGDEFVIMLDDARDAATVETLCAALIEDVARPFDFEGTPCEIGVSIGYRLQRGRPESRSAVFRAADMALYDAKRAGRNCFRAFAR